MVGTLLSYFQSNKRAQVDSSSGTTEPSSGNALENAPTGTIVVGKREKNKETETKRRLRGDRAQPKTRKRGFASRDEEDGDVDRDVDGNGNADADADADGHGNDKERSVEECRSDCDPTPMNLSVRTVRQMERGKDGRGRRDPVEESSDVKMMSEEGSVEEGSSSRSDRSMMDVDGDEQLQRDDGDEKHMEDDLSDEDTEDEASTVEDIQRDLDEASEQLSLRISRFERDNRLKGTEVEAFKSALQGFHDALSQDSEIASVPSQSVFDELIVLVSLDQSLPKDDLLEYLSSILYPREYHDKMDMQALRDRLELLMQYRNYGVRHPSGSDQFGYYVWEPIIASSICDKELRKSYSNKKRERLSFVRVAREMFEVVVHLRKNIARRLSKVERKKKRLARVVQSRDRFEKMIARQREKEEKKRQLEEQQRLKREEEERKRREKEEELLQEKMREEERKEKQRKLNDKFWSSPPSRSDNVQNKNLTSCPSSNDCSGAGVASCSLVSRIDSWCSDFSNLWSPSGTVEEFSTTQNSTMDMLAEKNAYIERWSSIRKIIHGRLVRGINECREDLNHDLSQLPEEASDRILRFPRMKFLFFWENIRPAYFGTHSRKLVGVSGRRPFGKDEITLNYEVDSDDEWEDDEDGNGDIEDIASGMDDDDDDDDDDEDDADGFMVPIGYLSDDEGMFHDGDGERKLGFDEEAEASELKNKSSPARKHRRNKFDVETEEDLKPTAYFCAIHDESDFEEEEEAEARDFLSRFAMKVFVHPSELQSILTVEIANSSKSSASAESVPSSVCESPQSRHQKNSLSDDVFRSFLHLCDGWTRGKSPLVEQFCELNPGVVKASLRRALSDCVERESGMFIVREEFREKFDLGPRPCGRQHSVDDTNAIHTEGKRSGDEDEDTNSIDSPPKKRRKSSTSKKTNSPRASIMGFLTKDDQKANRSSEPQNSMDVDDESENDAFSMSSSSSSSDGNVNRISREYFEHAARLLLLDPLRVDVEAKIVENILLISRQCKEALENKQNEADSMVDSLITCIRGTVSLLYSEHIRGSIRSKAWTALSECLSLLRHHASILQLISDAVHSLFLQQLLPLPFLEFSLLTEECAKFWYCVSSIASSNDIVVPTSLRELSASLYKHMFGPQIVSLLNIEDLSISSHQYLFGLIYEVLASQFDALRWSIESRLAIQGPWISPLINHFVHILQSLVREDTVSEIGKSGRASIKYIILALFLLCSSPSLSFSSDAQMAKIGEDVRDAIASVPPSWFTKPDVLQALSWLSSFQLKAPLESISQG